MVNVTTNAKVADREFNNLISPLLPVLTQKVKFSQDQILEKKTVLAFNTSTLEWVAYDSAGSNGINIASAILAEDLDSTGEDKYAQIYAFGSFFEDKLIFASTSDSVTEAVKFQLGSRGVYVVPSVP